MITEGAAIPWQKPGKALVECFVASLLSDTRVERREALVAARAA